jgi:CheY-like chemotaxis protein
MSVKTRFIEAIKITQYLRDCGYKVIEAANAEEAMTVLSHKETVINLVFTDIEMPGALDGFGLAQWVREHKPGIDVTACRSPTGKRTVRRRAGTQTI